MKIFNKKSYLSICAMGVLTACAAQTSPSMMNNSSVELVAETSVEQIALKDVNENILSSIASHYQKNADSPLSLSVTYDPKSKNFTAMKAVHALSHMKKTLSQKGVTNVTTHTIPVVGGIPTLMVSYDMLSAQAPSNCPVMPGIDSNDTTRFMGDYKFGCTTETMLSKQIATPSDLMGTSEMSPASARRESGAIEAYSAGEPNEPLQGLERDNLGS